MSTGEVFAVSPYFPRKVVIDNHFDFPIDIETLSNVNSSTHLLTFEDHLHGIRMKYPVDWEKIKDNSSTLDIAGSLIQPVEQPQANTYVQEIFGIHGPGNGYNNPHLAIFYQNLSSDHIALEDYVSNIKMSFLSYLENFKSVFTNKTILSNNLAYKLEFTYGQNSTTKVMEIATIIGNKAYIILYRTINPIIFSHYLPVIKTMVNSFTIANVIDIQKISYFSNGRTLNCTYWLASPFDEKGIFPAKNKIGSLPQFTEFNQHGNSPVESDNVNSITFGMFIDSDLNQVPDYLVSIDKTKNGNWTNRIIEFEPVTSLIDEAPERKIQNVTDENNFSFTNGKSYFNLAANLDLIGSPSRYKVLFFSSETMKNNNGTVNTISDFTNWISIPPPEIVISSVPKSIEVKQGEIKPISLQINSTSGYTPTVSLCARNNDQIGVKFKNNTLTIPSYGTSSVNLDISVQADATTGADTIPIFANIHIPPEFIAGSTGNNSASNNRFNISSTVTSEDITTQSILSITKIQKDPFYQPMLDFMNTFNVPLSFFSGIILGHIGPWLYNKVIRKLRKHGKSFDDWS